MANIKISELDELQKATDQDLLVIVDVANNETKKIQAGNLGTGGAEIPIGSTPPENPEEGDFWIDTSANGETYGDTLPIGAMVEYNGTTVPQGYEKVSDGNIIESGSNENGNWIKFVDGTMICYETFSIGGTTTDGQNDGSLWYVDISLQHSFAQKFISKPIIRINAYTSENANLHYLWVCTKYNSVTTSSFGNYRIYSPTNTTMIVSLDYIAIGKWK